MQHLRRMEDRVVMLTGGGGGIARGVARAFADEGASLILTDIFPDGMERTKRELEEEYGAKVLPLVMTDKLAQWGTENPEMFKRNLDEIPLGRYGDAQKDIGKVCVFLSSYDAKYVTGDTLFIQGGVGMKP